MANEAAQTTPKRFWIIGGVTLVYNLMGCANFVMQLSLETVAAMPEAVSAFIEARPLWATTAFALAVFGGALGCVLLLLRKPIALQAFVVSGVGAVVTLFDAASRTAPTDAIIGNVVQIAVTGFLIWYTRRALRLAAKAA